MNTNQGRECDCIWENGHRKRKEGNTSLTSNTRFRPGGKKKHKEAKVGSARGGTDRRSGKKSLLNQFAPTLLIGRWAKGHCGEQEQGSEKTRSVCSRGGLKNVGGAMRWQ